MEICDVCGSPSLFPEVLGSSKICKVCFMKINGLSWKHKTFETYEEAENQRKKVVESAMRFYFPQRVLDEINAFFYYQKIEMKPCDACGAGVRTLEQVGEAKICKSCFSKLSLAEWNNEDAEDNRKKIIEIAEANEFPPHVIESIHGYLDKYMRDDLICVLKGKGQTLRAYDTKMVLETHIDFSPEELASDYAKMKSKEQGNSLAAGAEAVVSGLLVGDVVKAGVSLATNVAGGKVVNQFSGRGELGFLGKGAREIYYENCVNVELVAPNDTELACIRIQVEDSKTALRFLFKNTLRNVKYASRLCSYISLKKHQAENAPLIEASLRQVSVAAAKETSGAEEIMKFKNLLDAGVITQEEFDAKKRQLLGL